MGCSVPFLTRIQEHDNGPSTFGHYYTYIGITISPFFEILDRGSRWLINLLVIVILSKDEKIMGELLTDFRRNWYISGAKMFPGKNPIRLQVIQPRGSLRNALILFTYLSVDLWWYNVNICEHHYY